MRLWAFFICKWWWNDSLFTTENHLSCFEIFFNVNCLLMVYSVYHFSCFLKVVIGVKYCSCSLVAKLVTDLCLWLAEAGRRMNFWRCIQNLHLVLRRSDINEGRCIQLTFCSLFWWVQLHHWMEKCYSIRGSGLRLKFYRIAFLRKSLQLDSKTGLTTNALNWSVFVGVGLGPLSSYLHGLKCARIGHLCFLSKIWCLFDY